ncbi:MAG: hypothetical protein HOE19_00405 [Candidatus Komeilibacteria bacterium]|jgi:hypothetical protein|nr:hypothetical protein [Candidatus Komeilibacteria bacterium]MBT4447407.1 hypothetical protein [Candidatus Komeilibacteria bacterium]
MINSKRVKQIIGVLILLYVLYFAYLFFKPIHPVFVGVSIKDNCISEGNDYTLPIPPGQFGKFDNLCCKDLVAVDLENIWGATHHYHCISYNDYKWRQIKNDIFFGFIKY